MIINVINKCIEVLKDNKLKRNECDFMCPININNNNQEGGKYNNIIDKFLYKLNICKQIYILKINDYSKCIENLNSII